MTQSKRGGMRPGAERPKGSVSPEGTRKQHQVRAFDDEWDLIYRFAKLIKSGKIKACKVAVEKLGKSSID